MKYIAFIYTDEHNDGYNALVPDLEGCFSCGKTFEEAVEMIKEAAELYCEDLKILPNASSLEELMQRDDLNLKQNAIEYKGYICSIEYSSEDKLFFGKIELIDDLVTFEADSASELETNFHNAVDGYLQTCKELGRKPQKTYKGVFNIRIDPKLHQKIHQEALKAGISLNAFVQNMLKSKVAATQH